MEPLAVGDRYRVKYSGQAVWQVIDIGTNQHGTSYTGVRVDPDSRGKEREFRTTFHHVLAQLKADNRLNVYRKKGG